MTSYSEFKQQLKNAGIALSPAELHGFLSGLVCGGIAVVVCVFSVCFTPSA